MQNVVMLLGRIAKIEENGVTIKVQRNFKNKEGIYEEDMVNVRLYENMSNNVNDYCKIGDIIAIKGRIQTKENNIQIIAEKISFLSSKREG